MVLNSTAPAPLAGLRVLALENFVAGPLASMLLADWGADVVKVEPPGGDAYRSFPPVERSAAGESSASFARINRSKRSVLLDVASAEGAATFRTLAAAADVVIENLKPGTMDRFGLGYDSLAADNPRLIVVSISGFGQPDIAPGPYLRMPSFDLIGQAMSGLAYATGGPADPPAAIGFPLIDTATADWAAMATLLALRQRDATGRGQHLDVAMYDVAIHLNEYHLGAYARSGDLPVRGRLPTSAPFEFFAASDGHVAIAVSGQAIFERFCRAIDRPELGGDPRFADGTLRSRAMDAVLKPLVEAWTRDRTVAQTLARLAEFGVPASPVQTVADVHGCPHVAARGMVVAVKDPVLGEIGTAGNPIKGTALPETVAGPPPQLGEHTESVLREWTAP